MPRSGKLPVLNLLTGQKSGRLVSPIQVKLGRADARRARGSAWLCKISPQSPNGVWECGPKISKISTLFGKETTLTDFENFWRFLRPTILYQCFKFDVIRFIGYGVIAEKPRVGKLSHIFPCIL